MGIISAVIKRTLRAKPRKRMLKSFGHSTNFGLIIHSKEDEERAQELQSWLRSESKTVQRIYVVDEREKKISEEAKGNQAMDIKLYLSDFNALKLPKSARAKNWTKEQFDYLIHCGIDNIKISESVFALNQSGCKIISSNNPLSDYGDIVIEHEMDDFCSSIQNTLKQINKHG